MPSLMESIISLDVGAQEPWPNDVQLFQPYPMEQILLPDNANCLATQAYLHMCGLPFKIEHRANAEFMSPSGKVPFIKCGAFVVSELEPIVQFIANKGISLTQDFDNEQKSDLRAYMSLIFSVLMNAELYICWCDKRTYNEVTKVRNGSVYPWPLNHYQNWTKRSAVIKKLKLLNWYQKTLGSVYQEVETCCQALSERLEGKEYFFGSKPTEVDALLYGHTYSIFSNPVDFPNLFVIFQRFPNLIIHCRRICFYYTFLRYIDFTKTDTNIESSREPSAHNLIVKSETSLFTHLWNYITINMYEHRHECTDVDVPDNLNANNETGQIVENIPQLNNNEISFKRTVDSCIKLKSSFAEDIDSPKSINYLGHKVIQQHLQQDLRNKLSDFTIDTNSDLWSEKDLCYIISDRDLIRINMKLDVEDDYDTKQNLDYTHCSGSNSCTSNISEQLDWLHGSSTSTIDINSSNNKNDTLNDQENIEIDVDNKSNCNSSELDWLTDNTSDTKVDNFDHHHNINDDNNNNNENVQTIITFDLNNNMDVKAQNIIEPKFSNCSIKKMIINDSHSLDLDVNVNVEQNAIYDLENKPSNMDFIVDAADVDVDADAKLNLIEKCSTTSNTNAWTTVESASDSGDNSVVDNMDSTVEFMNDIINSVEQMNCNNAIEEKKKSEVDSSSELTIETYSDNHICNENCDNIFVVNNDDSFWDDDVSKSVSETKKSTLSCTIEQRVTIKPQYYNNMDNKILEKKQSDIKICCHNNVIDKISNESLKKYFSCESCKQVIHIERNESRSSIIEEYPVNKLSNVIIAVNQAYPENEFLKLLKSDYDICSKSASNEGTNSTVILHNCDERFFEQNENEKKIESHLNSPSKPRVFRKCRRLLNKSGDTNNPTMHSDSKILQMYNEKILEHRNKSDNDIENIRTACSVLKSFNTKPEQCKACSLCKFSSNPSISHSCKCCDSCFKFKSKSVNKFS